MALSQQAFGSPGAHAAARPSSTRTSRPCGPARTGRGSERFDGEQGMGLGDGTGVLQDLADLDELADQLSQTYDGARMDDLDLDKLARQLGGEAAVDARTLQRLEQALRDSGYLKRTSDGQLKLSPKAMRQLGRALLRDVANRMSGRQGQRDLRQAGAAGERSGATRAWEFGDTEPWDVTRTVTNAVQRVVADGGDPRSGVRLHIDDVEVTETEARTQACVALLVDTSFSMAMDGRWVPMKRTALALHTLIRSRFRGDDLQLITFGRYAQTMDIEELTAPRRPLGQGHQPAPRAAAGQPALPQAPQRPAGAADRHRRRADLPPRAGRRGLLRVPAPPADRRVRRPRARQRRPARRADDVLPARRRPRPGPVHRLDGPPGRRTRRRRPSSTTSAPRSSARTSARGRLEQNPAMGTTETGSADEGSGSAAEDLWVSYFDGTEGHEPRPLLVAALEAAGAPRPGAVAVELGCGSGVETVVLLRAGWVVHAMDGSSDGVRRTVARAAEAGLADGLTATAAGFEDYDVPAADLVYAGYSLPFCAPEHFPRVWRGVRDALRPGALLAVNLFGDHDTWARRPVDELPHPRRGRPRSAVRRAPT